MPEDVAQTLLPDFLKDSSAKVRSKAAGEQHDTKREWVLPLLCSRRVVEADPAVLSSIEFSIDSIKSRP